MSDVTQVVVRKVLAIVAAAMVITTLSAISIVRADQRDGNVAVGGNGGQTGQGSGSQGGSEGNGTFTGDGGSSQGANSLGGGTGPGGAGGATGGGTGPGAAVNRAGGGTGTAAATGDPRLLPHKGTDCPDYNPNVGVFCDHFLVGGTTVLSGPLAVYGDQGIKGGLAWITYFNSTIAPREKLRTAKLIWYDDNLDPNKTLQYVQRLNEVDHVLYLGGITSPESASRYLDSAKMPMIGDIGLSPKSYTNRYIFATAPSEQTRNPIRIKTAKQRFGITSFSVIQDVLPSVDTTPVKASWDNAAKTYDLKKIEYVEIPSTASDCSSQFAKVISTSPKPDYIIMPTASAVLLACLREARKFSVSPKSSSSPWLKGWSGGSNLQLEVDNCKPLCEGMLSIGTVFNDPRTSQTEQMKTYRQNMAKYAPNVDTTGFIAINYYHAGYVFYSMVKQKGIQN
ncbi:MAG TPA: ABC transporter substrate-binding protein, partial [Acidimicrobiales bacterium]|nr:ABC transporter substrate-binding protein [Acidimicrobiales bacterium]